MNEDIKKRISLDVEFCSKNLKQKIVGLDEVGYGAFAGPIVVGMVMVDPNSLLEGIDSLIEKKPILARIRDSKKLSSKVRQSIIDAVSSLDFIATSLGQASVEEINALGVVKAHDLAVQRAMESTVLKDLSDFCVAIDGNKIDSCLQGKTVEFIVKGDDLSFAIGLASVIAKEYRDSLMIQLSRDFPNYDWDKNKGYGSQKHRDALKNTGLSIHHRIKYCKNWVK